jgi:hypothetical protein
METNDAFATLHCCNELLQCLGALLLPHASIMHRETGRVICKECPSRDVSSNIVTKRAKGASTAFFHNKTQRQLLLFYKKITGSVRETSIARIAGCASRSPFCKLVSISVLYLLANCYKKLDPALKRSHQSRS